MSRLDSFIRRLQAQRACLNAAVELIGALDGPVLEIGLGNGRTYDHLREICRSRPIYVFDRHVAAHPDCVPPQEYLILGDFRETLPQMAGRAGACAALVHLDCGSGDAAADRRLVNALLPGMLDLMKPGGILVSDQEIKNADFISLDLPAGVNPGRYYMLRRI